MMNDGCKGHGCCSRCMPGGDLYSPQGPSETERLWANYIKALGHFWERVHAAQEEERMTHENPESGQRLYEVAGYVTTLRKEVFHASSTEEAEKKFRKVGYTDVQILHIDDISATYHDSHDGTLTT